MFSYWMAWVWLLQSCRSSASNAIVAFFFFNGLLMVLLHFLCKLLPNMRKQHIAAVSPEVFCLWLLTWKYYLIHPLLIDVNIVFLRMFWPIHRFCFKNEPCQLPLMSVICLTTKVSYNISGLGGLIVYKCPAHFPSACPRFFIDGRNTQIRCIKSKWSKISCIRPPDTKTCIQRTLCL